MASNTILSCRPHFLKAERIAGASSVRLVLLALIVHVCRPLVRLDYATIAQDVNAMAVLSLMIGDQLALLGAISLGTSLFNIPWLCASDANASIALCSLSGSTTIPGDLR